VDWTTCEVKCTNFMNTFWILARVELSSNKMKSMCAYPNDEEPVVFRVEMRATSHTSQEP
jgi:hypothetical protein